MMTTKMRAAHPQYASTCSTVDNWTPEASMNSMTGNSPMMSMLTNSFVRTLSERCVV